MSRFSRISLWKDLARALPEGLGDKPAIKIAFALAFDAHEGQFRVERDPKRKSIPYIVHPVGVAKLVIALWSDNEFDCDIETLICVALLHDTLEDTSLEYDEIRTKLSSDVADLTDRLTKPEVSGEDKKQRNRLFREQIVAAGQPAIFVKICDALHNLSRPEGMPTKLLQKSIIKAEETYLPMLLGVPFESRLSAELRNAIGNCRKVKAQRNKEEFDFDPFDLSSIINFISRTSRSKSIENHDLVDIMSQIPGVTFVHYGDKEALTDLLTQEFFEQSREFWGQAIHEATALDFKFSRFCQKRKYEFDFPFTDLMRIELHPYGLNGDSAVVLTHDGAAVPSWFSYETASCLVRISMENQERHRLSDVLAVHDLARRHQVDLSVNQIEELNINERDLLVYINEYALGAIHLAQLQRLISEVVEPAQAKRITEKGGRIKSLTSLLAKRNRTVSLEFGDMEDFIGLRLVCVSKADAKATIRSIEKALMYDNLQLPLSKPILNLRVNPIISRSGYKATHITFQIDEAERLGRLLGCEIQIRTALQDLWAGVSEMVRYKKQVSKRVTLEKRLRVFSDWCEEAEAQVSKFDVRDDEP